jgi:hypothetical protein
MHAYWIKYTEGGIKQELNAIQNQLAFGYNSTWISHELIEFSFVSYEVLKLYIAMSEDGQYRVITNFGDQKVILNNIYVYAHEFGVFPDVRFVEFYGLELGTYKEIRQKITIE